MIIDFWLRCFTILVLAVVRIYWYLAKRRSEFNKQKTKNKFFILEKIGLILSAFIIGLNLLGFSFFTFESVFFQFIGFIIVILGSIEAVMGRLALGNNWSESYEYQIKVEQKLVIHGIYQFVRHPIYGGFMIAVTGAFMVAKTYLFIPILLFQLALMMRFAKREEELLINYFGKKYIVYMQKTKMLIPFLI